MKQLEFSDLNSKIRKLWSRYQPRIGRSRCYEPTVYSNDVKKNSILFIGCNPSRNMKFIREKIPKKCLNLNKSKREELLTWSGVRKSVQKFGDLNKIEEYAFEHYPYFKKFIEISRYVNTDKRSHIDVFHVRCSKQNLLKKELLKRDNFNHFAKEQIAITKKVILKIEPSVILVANAFVADIFFKEMLFRLFKNSNINNGYHTIKVKGRSIPIFFTSMLTGQRALDKYSFERLKWHIYQAYKK